MKQLLYKTFPIIRTFTSDKLIKSHFFNSKGLQVFRMKLAQKRYEIRKFKVKSIYENEYNNFLAKGFLLIPEFLKDNDFQELRNECYDILKIGEYRKFGRKDGPNMIYMLDIFSLDLSKYRALNKLIQNEYINDLFSIMEKRQIKIPNKDIVVQIQYLVQGDENGTEDPETQLHSDTFFNTHKAWLYLDDVGIENGPFVFVPKTHNIYIEGRLKREKEYSENINLKGSRRVSNDELLSLGLHEEVFNCKKNTLLMANTLGYHRRLRGVSGNDRLTIAFSARSNPFL
ncbi:MAG: phytanoyl-CoA dioxygenase family protein [Saprospiraceae bacterium]